MTCRRSLSAVALLLACALAPSRALRAQEGDDAGASRIKESGAGDGEEDALRRKAELAGKVDPGPAPIGGGLDRFMVPVTSIEPARIPPGGTGTLIIAFVMREGAVLATAADLELKYSPAQSPAQLGTWTIDDPKPGTGEGAFRGKPVFENYAIVRIPLSVDAGAAHGKYPLSASVIAKLADPRLGANIGQFQGPATAQLVVGPPLPTPPRPVAVAAGSGGPTLEPAVRVDPQAGGAPVADDGSPAGTGELVARPAVGRDLRPSGSPPEGAGESADYGEGGDDGLLWIGGGVVGLGLLVLAIGALRAKR
ncbi:MAG: hypothetical protein HZB39_17110 [Planctomycetes bacterium]|nr:hypothetical protein [Planctomycetota bacterium]